MTFFVDLLISLVQSFVMMQELAILTQKTVPFRYTLYLGIASHLLYYPMSSFFFIFIVGFAIWVSKRIDAMLPPLLCWFYGVYCVFFYALFGYIATIALSEWLGASYSTYEIFLNLTIIPLSPLVLSHGYAHFLRPPLAFLRQHYDQISHRFLIVVNLLLTICCGSQFLGYWLEDHIFINGNPFRENTLLIFTGVMITILLYFAYQAKSLNQRQLQSLKEQQLADITDYAAQIETMYQDLRGFRHDFQNVLLSLEESIKSRDVAIIEANYRETLARYGLALRETRSVLPRLQKISALPIKSLLSSKVIAAEEKGLQVTLEVADELDTAENDLVAFLRVLAILLDNAIEAAAESQQQYLGISILESEVQTVSIIIENSYAERPVLAELFKKDYSTKGTDRGQGLSIVQQILEDNHNLSLQTKLEDHLFSQIVKIRREKSL